jgi:hypothetical protein
MNRKKKRKHSREEKKEKKKTHREEDEEPPASEAAPQCTITSFGRRTTSATVNTIVSPTTRLASPHPSPPLPSSSFFSFCCSTVCLNSGEFLHRLLGRTSSGLD